MTPERWREVERICEGALACAPAERSAYVSAACGGDEALQREVESLLAQEASAERFIEEPAIAAAGALAGLSGLRAGQRLGPYHIVSKIGAGGMGEVYRARDTQLGREVAVKILPPVFASDADRLARFEREARVLASLNHPHIASIYGVHTDVSDDGQPVRALVMELVEGLTLATRIARGPVPIAEALPIARQIADALAAAHEKGIVHRDLKPANIKLTPEGVVKVLDFGLAKTATAVTGEDPSNSPTLTAGGTHGGVILGTAAYMSPEQARGQAVDRRTDIWAFGCVLYELLTGRSAFTGTTVTDVLAHVVERDPDWSSLPANTPTPVRYLLSQCLDKNPKQRLRDISAVRLAFDLVHSERTDASLEGTRRSRRSALGWFASAAALIVIFGVSAALYLYRPARPADETRLEITPPPRSLPFEFALAPNGRHIVFVAAPDDDPRRLWLRPLDGDYAQPLAGTDGAHDPFWSADSRWIGFFASGKLYRIDISGGPPQQLAKARGPGGAWNADNVILFSSAGGLVRIPASGGEPVQVTHVDPSAPTVHVSPQFLPDGRHFLFYALGGEQSGVYLASLDGDMPHRLMPAETAAAYVAPDWLLYVRKGTLVARRFDRSREQLTGEEVVVSGSVSADPGVRGGFSVSADGRTIALQSPQASLDELSSFDRLGRRLGVAIGGADARDRVGHPELSPNGKRVAVTRLVQDNVDVWIKDLESGVLTPLTRDALYDSFPIWSHNGNTIAFSSNRSGVPSLYSKPSTGTGDEELLIDGPATPQDWSRDGKFILYGTYTSGSANPSLDIWVFDVAAKKKRVIAADSRAEERHGQFSPDGHWIAYVTDASGQFEVVVLAFPDGGQLWQVSRDGGTQPRWRADSREIYFLAPGGKLMAAPVSATYGKTQANPIGKPAELFTTLIRETNDTRFRPQYDVTSERNFLVSQPAETSPLPLRVILNWAPGASK